MRLITGLIALTLPVPAVAATFTEARSAYEQNKVAEAERLFAQLSVDPAATIEDRAKAWRELARIAWLIDRDAPKALRHLDAARATGDQPCDTAAMTARVLREGKLSAQAIAQSDDLLRACPEAARRDAILLHLIGARLDFAAADSTRRPGLIAEANEEVAKFSSEAGIRSAQVKLETALLAGRADAALAAWKDYFWLSDTDAPQLFEKEGVTAIFADGLRPGASVSSRLKLAELLMRAGFHEQSRRFAAQHKLETVASKMPTWRKLSAYFAMRDEIDVLILDVNRGLARGRRDEKAIESALMRWMPLLLSAAGEAVVPKDPRPVMLKHYGLVGGPGLTNGYPGANIGHAIEDRHDTITQYGTSAKVHLQVLDHMIANGFESWLWDGGAMTGGWSSKEVIVHVRPGYVASPQSAFRMTKDGIDRRELLERYPRRYAEDLGTLQNRKVATLESLNDRLHLQLVDRIAATARSKSNDEATFRRAFLEEYYRANLDQSIEKHEGRHAIDEVLGITPKVEQAVLEYDAKLSELALADYPRMALINMNRALEGSGPHDRAAARIFAEIVDWIERNPARVLGYDPKVAAMAQIDKLTDAQIREIARGLDRLARGDMGAPAKLEPFKPSSSAGNRS